MDTFIILIVVMVSRVCTYVETHQTVHFKCVQVVVSRLHGHKIAKTKASGERAPPVLCLWLVAHASVIQALKETLGDHKGKQFRHMSR